MKVSETPHFLGVPDELAQASSSLFHVIPAPYEATVSYGSGTAQGPDAILEASTQVEFFDGISSPMEHGIYTHPPLALDGLSGELATEVIRKCVAKTLDSERIPVLLGGEHSVSYGAIKAAKEKYGSIGVVQFDAHSDLRDSYEGSPYSHACVMRRVIELDAPLFQIGVRSMCAEDVSLRKDYNIGHLDAAELARGAKPSPLLPEDFPKLIYLSFDIDAFDPSLVPATGTPEPGGLFWWQALDMIEQVCQHGTIIGFDVVELAPASGMHASDFVAAKLVYSIMGCITRSQIGVTQ